MSVLARLKANKPAEKKLFGVVAGRRTSGKTTLAGTLPGKTLLIQAGVLESGSKSAETLAKNNGNELTVVTFHSLTDLTDLLTELKADTEFDNIYLDSLTAVTEIKYDESDVQRMLKKDNWAAFREIGKAASDVLLQAKSLTYNEQTKKPKNVFVTMAVNIKTDANGNTIDLVFESKGNKAASEVIKLGEAVVTVVTVQSDNGPERKLVTRSVDFFPGRVDGLVDENNPGMIEADLSQLLKLINA